MKLALKRAGIINHAGCHTFRHCFATHMLENSINIRVVQHLMGHADVKTAEIYTHVMEKNISAIVSPLDSLMDSPHYPSAKSSTDSTVADMDIPHS